MIFIFWVCLILYINWWILVGMGYICKLFSFWLSMWVCILVLLKGLVKVCIVLLGFLLYNKLICLNVLLLVFIWVKYFILIIKGVICINWLIWGWYLLDDCYIFWYMRLNLIFFFIVVSYKWFYIYRLICYIINIVRYLI